MSPTFQQRIPAYRRAHRRRILAWTLFPAILVGILLMSACQKKEREAGEKSPDQPVSIAVFIPGFVEGSPNYEMLVQGSREAVPSFRKPRATLTPLFPPDGNLVAQ